jgi:hypothetical protein
VLAGVLVEHQGLLGVGEDLDHPHADLADARLGRTVLGVGRRGGETQDQDGEQPEAHTPRG